MQFASEQQTLSAISGEHTCFIWYVEFIILMWAMGMTYVHPLPDPIIDVLFLVCFQVSTRAKLSLKILNVDLSYI